MMRRVGSWPSTKAGKATEAQMDFRLRGGTVMIKRLILPFSTRSSAGHCRDVPIVLQRLPRRNNPEHHLCKAIKVELQYRIVIDPVSGRFRLEKSHRFHPFDWAPLR